MPSLFNNTKNTRAILKDSLRYIRSDCPNRLTSEDVQWLADNNVLTLVDLRTEEEVAEKPIGWADERFRYVNMPVSGGCKIPKSSDEVCKAYIKMADAQMKKIIDFIEESQTNVMYFCNAGKDRTGVVSAILLLHNGADKDRIIKDYMISAENLSEMLSNYCIDNPDIDINVIVPKQEYITRFMEESEF